MQLTGQKALIVVAVGSFLVGLLLGWLVIGWWLWPVEYYDTDPFDLRPQHKMAYVAMVADSYSLTHDLKQAQQRLAGWPEDELATILSDLTLEYTKLGRGSDVQRVMALTKDLGITLTPQAPAAEATPAPAGKSVWGTVLAVCGIIVAILLLIAGGALGWSYLQKHRKLPIGKPTAAAKAPAEAVAPPGALEPSALGTFVTTYNIGDDSYDDCFPIETAAGEFLGECGVGISETLGEGTPSLVTAFELWLFDKSDIRTVTKVLMSEYAFTNDELRERLESKGEPVLAEPGKTILLETASLKVLAEIKELAYGAGAGPEQSYFARLSMELVAMAKETETGAQVAL